VIAVDIQEYSRVLCSAVLNPPALTPGQVQTFLDRVHKKVAQNLAFGAPLIEYERACLVEAQRDNPEKICELIDHGSMVAFQAKRVTVTRDFEQAHNRIRTVDGPETMIFRLYGGLFFSYKQAAEFDALLAVAHGSDNRDFFLAAIISTASEVVNTVGKHFAQPIRPRSSDGKPKRHLVAKILRDREIDVLSVFSVWLNRYRSLPKATRKHSVIRADYADALATLDRKVSAVYADPPYTRDHYSRFYHVLETMCIWDDPGVSTTRIRADTATLSRGMYRADRHQSPFCIRSQAPGAFETLFRAVRGLNSPLVLSYSPYASDSEAHPRVMTVAQIISLAGKHFDSVETVSAGKFSHMKLNASRLHMDASAEAELIFLCR
jgi:hypothetical protein